MPAIIFFSRENLRLALNSNKNVVNSLISRSAIKSFSLSALSTRTCFATSDNCFLRTLISLFNVPICSERWRVWISNWANNSSTSALRIRISLISAFPSSYSASTIFRWVFAMNRALFFISFTSCLNKVLKEYLILSNKAWNSFDSLSLKSTNTLIAAASSTDVSTILFAKASAIILSTACFWSSVSLSSDTPSVIWVCVNWRAAFMAARLATVVLIFFSAITCVIRSVNNLPEIANGATSNISRNWLFNLESFSFNAISNSFCFLRSSTLIALPSRISRSCNWTASALYCWIWLSTLSRSSSFVLICASKLSTPAWSLSNLALLAVEPALFRNLRRRFSRFLLMSSYFFIPKTSL